MIITFLLLLLFYNGLTIRPDTSILFSRIGLLIIFYSILSSVMSFHITYLQKGIGLYGGLFNVTSVTSSIKAEKNEAINQSINQFYRGSSTNENLKYGERGKLSVRSAGKVNTETATG